MQGFASGDLEQDALGVRLFAERGLEFICTQSFAKNFGLYNERVGNMVVVLNNTKEIVEVKSQITSIIRGMYSNPPNHGARVVATVLKNPDLFEQWYLIFSRLIPWKIIYSRCTKSRIFNFTLGDLQSL